MNITDEGMMGFNLNRKNSNTIRIKIERWNNYIVALEACLEAETEYRIYLELLLTGKVKMDYK